MALSTQQQQVLRAFNKAARDTKASPKIRKALIEAGLVESHLQNLNYGDRDSKGALQQRSSQGWNHATDPYLAAVDFIKHAQPIAHKYGTAGQLAQAVQRSAFPARYDQVAGQASSLLGAAPRSTYSPSSASSGTPAITGTGDIQKQIALSLLGFGNVGGDSMDPLTMALSAAAQKGPTSPLSPSLTPSHVQSGGTVKSGGRTSFDGKPVASWIAPILEKARKSGYWKGSVTSGIRTKSQQLAAAKHYGLQHYPHGPLASNHVEGNPGAVDVSDPQGLKQALRAIHNGKLKSAMPEDPVHFSGSGY